ncbi:MAG: class I SAM-dependent rRNA methyltransferase [Campylobacterales bacterium]|nr:class I SAM-dependent rRNA methyltransferase [Campylobacterales bacterium]
MKKLVVKNSAAKKLRLFNPWVYQNEIAMLPQGLESGELVEVVNLKQESFGIGYANVHSVITLRMLSFVSETIDAAWIKNKLHRAISARNPIMEHSNACRLVHSEADGLAGLIVDFYDGVLSLAINTAGMERFRKEIIAALVEIVEPLGIYEKSDASAREKEGLETKEGLVYGEAPDLIEVLEYGCKFGVELGNSQKTGFYLDQRFNHGLLTEYIDEESTMLDLFCNVGGFGMHALNAGAASVTFVDISKSAIEQVKKNLKLNEFAAKRAVCVAQNAMDYIKEAAERKESYDIVVLDPPSFAKTKEQAAGAISGFKHLMLNGIKVCKPGGVIALFSCSYHVSMDDLIELSLDASRDTGVQLRVLEHLYQDKDHPYILNMPNSLYLKGLLFQRVE